jgi:hypothetical protein
METTLATTQTKWSLDQAYREIELINKGQDDMTMRLEQTARHKNV